MYPDWATMAVRLTWAVPVVALVVSVVVASAVFTALSSPVKVMDWVPLQLLL